MPQSWEASWKPPKVGTVHDRAQRVHTLGNLTLLTAKLNSTVSNGPWSGNAGKKAALLKHDLLLLNRDLDSFSPEDWTDESIEQRTEKLVGTILDIWRVPPGYKSATVREAARSTHSVDLSDLLSAGLLTVGQKIVPTALNLQDHTGQILSDGRIDINGQVFETPSGAGYHLRKRSTNGWSFWLVDPKTKRSLASLRREYLEMSSLEPTSTGDEDDDNGDEDSPD